MNLKITLFLICFILSNVIQTIVVNKGISQERYYALKEEKSFTYKEGSIIKVVGHIFRLQCFIECNVMKECKHVTYNDATKSCKLLKNVAHIDVKGHADHLLSEEIYSPVPGK